jgi:hypothetical protein
VHAFAADTAGSTSFYPRNRRYLRVVFCADGIAQSQFDRVQGTLGTQNGERTRLARWLESLAVASRPLQRRVAETNFQCPLRSF